MKASRNRTIDLDEEEGKEYLERTLRVDAPVSLSDITDRTLMGDTFSVLPNLPDGFADLVIADPPYNLEKDFNGKHFRHISDVEYTEYTGRWLDLILPKLKDTGSIYVCCDWQSSPGIYLALKERLHVRNRITWQREKGRGAARNWKNGMEDIYFATVSNRYTFNVDAVKIRRKVMAPYRQNGRPKDWEATEEGNFRNTYPSNFWDDISIPYWSMKENTAHPTQKSEKLLAKLILASSHEGDTVLDPFLGSGSTSVAAKKLGRHFVGIEREARYCIWAEKRLEMAEDDREIQGYTDGVFWERNTYKEQRRK